MSNRKVGFLIGNMEMVIYAVVCYGFPKIIWSMVNMLWTPSDLLYGLLGFSLLSYYFGAITAVIVYHSFINHWGNK